MFFHVILTDDCNLCCRYCRGREFDALIPRDSFHAIDSSLPAELSYDLKDLYSFLKRDPGACVTFYGGEPLMRMDLIRTIMDKMRGTRFMIQTNGLLLNELGRDYINRMETILVSIDGPEGITDYNRGKGTFSRVTENIRRIRAEGFTGEIIARMTVTEGTDVSQAVRYLDKNPLCSFPSVHWQIDAGFSDACRMDDFAAWLGGTYMPGIRKLVSAWVRIMEQEGRVARWYPFLQTAEDLLLEQRALLRCGCGYANYTINTDGHIGPCPVMVGMRDFYVGHITTADPRTLPVVAVSGTCTDCDILDFCGGRCLYADITRPWKEEQKSLICATVRDLREGIIEAIPAIKEMIRKGTIAREDFAHTRFNGCEIIP
jgi:uncharacterized protein